MSATLQPALEQIDVYIDDNYIGGRVYILMGDGRDSVTNNVNAWLSEGAYKELYDQYNNDELAGAIQCLIEKADSMVYARSKKRQPPKVSDNHTVPNPADGTFRQLTFRF